MREIIINNVELVTLFFVIIMATFFVAYLFNKFFGKFIYRSSLELDADPTNYKFLRYLISAIIYIVGFSLAIYIVPALRAIASSMLAGAGILALAVGLASQQALGNIVSGMFIIIFKPFRLNDRLKIRENVSGIVEDITLRHTVIRDFENKRIIIPNSVISNEIITNSDFAGDKIIRWVDMNISFSSDIKLAKKIMCEEILNHPLHVDPRTPEQLENGEPEVIARVISMGDFSVLVRAWAWAANAPDAFVMGCDLLETVKERFEQEGIEIPFPHRTVLFSPPSK